MADQVLTQEASSTRRQSSVLANGQVENVIGLLQHDGQELHLIMFQISPVPVLIHLACFAITL